MVESDKRNILHWADMATHAEAHMYCFTNWPKGVPTPRSVLHLRDINPDQLAKLTDAGYIDPEDEDGERRHVVAKKTSIGILFYLNS